MNMKKWFQSLTGTLQLVLFLPKCKGCENVLVFEGEKLICRECREKIAASRYYDNWKTVCRLCGRWMDHQHDTCGNCILQPPPYRKHLSYSRYEGLLKDLILGYKYGNIERLKLVLAEYLGELFTEKVNEPFDYIVPVPADTGRKREFHPMLEVSKILSRRLRIPLMSRQLLKIKKTPPQAGLTRAQRLKNLEGAFILKNPEKIKEKKLLLIDDVYTTGTTIGTCTRLLVDQKADVVALTLARS